MTVSLAHIFVFATLADDLIDGKHNLGGEGGFVASALQILINVTGEKVGYTLAGQIGGDASGKFLKDSLEQIGVDVSSLTVSSISTCQAITKGVKKTEFVRFDGGPLCRFSAEETKRHLTVLKASGWMYANSNTLIDDETWAQLHSILSFTPRLLFFDLNWRWPLVERGKLSKEEFLIQRVIPFLNHVHVLKGTQEEFEFLEKVLETTKTSFFQRFPKFQWIVETKGPEGISISTRDREIHEKGPSVPLVQDTGAGDVVSGTLLFELARRGIHSEDQLRNLDQRHILRAIHNANKMAAMTIQGFGVEHLLRSIDGTSLL